MANILQKAATGAKKTWLLYGANLSFSQYQRYIKTLIDLGLIAEKDGLYTPTEKGRAFLENYRALVNLLGESDGLARNVQKESSKIKANDTWEGRLATTSNHDIEAKVLNTGNR